MDIALITGSAGLIGAESVRFFSKKGFKVVGIDNDMRKVFFGEEASTEWSRKKLEYEIKNYIHYREDIRDRAAMEAIFKKYSNEIKLIIHTAAQPSHDWAAKDPFTDFTVNANGTLTLLEMTRQNCPDAVFIFTSTNKVYGDTPNSLPLVELETRWEIDESHPYYENGIDESMSVDHTKHSLFGASKLAADVLVQEYGRYFDMRTVCFRGGCLTGPGHSSTELHGFLAYLMKCAVTGNHYTIYGYKGKQVRDNIHSFDLVNAFWHFYQKPRRGEVYNMGGSRHSNCSMLEAISMCEEISGKKMNYSYIENNRIGDHIWWISDVSKFKSHYPGWNYKYNLKDILVEIFNNSVFSQIQ
ncbi:MAG: NAD-dependent epimerase/dehydratase family protein [Candidatus Methanoperedens sp.]|nr:NAD-dependent epimerase/dehydratase family protein [Candidatus Methanoperedens sp.]MCZ7371222.1 NAD-dependent epimerase/dehydratase family protein [Candidatus Methanoperedens sp.]